MALAIRDSVDLIAVGRQALDGVDDDDRQRDAPNGGDVLVDENVVDDAADDPRRQRRGQRDDAEHGERQRIALPMLEALVGQQPLEQRCRRRIEIGAEAPEDPSPELQIHASFSGGPRPARVALARRTGGGNQGAGSIALRRGEGNSGGGGEPGRAGTQLRRGIEGGAIFGREGLFSMPCVETFRRLAARTLPASRPTQARLGRAM